MLLICRGSGTPAFGKMAGSPFSVPATTAVRATFTPKGTDSHIVYNPTAQTFGLTFPDGYLKTLMTDALQDCAFNPLLFREDAQLFHLAQIIEAEIAGPGFASPMVIEGVSRAIAVILLRLDQRPILAEAERIKLPPWRLRRVLDFIDSHLEDDVRLSNLAAIAGLSTFHFARVFRQETGVTPYNYVRARRIERSQALLIEGKLGISELALACGFASQSHFTAAFSKAVGTSPGRFRRENGK
ncbi:MAG: AraC family transcriptional regulator [Sphingomonas sp.]|nr:AraC family transcriptional regulator [Sphingomonas sp.]